MLKPAAFKQQAICMGALKLWTLIVATAQFWCTGAVKLFNPLKPLTETKLFKCD